MYICLDIGGTNIRIAKFVDKNAKKYERIIKFEAKNDAKTDFDNIKKTIKDLKENNKILGIGISLPGTVDKKGKIFNTPNLPNWNGKNLKTVLAIFKTKVEILNDAKAAALGEAYFSRKKQDFLFIIWGTGVGGGRVHYVDGKLSVLEMGPGWQIISKYEIDRKAKLGYLENYCGGAGIRNLYGKPAEKLNKKEWEMVSHDLGIGLASLLTVHPVNKIVFGGGIALKQKSQVKIAVKYLKKYLHTFPAPKEVKFAKFGEDAGLYGAFVKIIF